MGAGALRRVLLVVFLLPAAGCGARDEDFTAAESPPSPLIEGFQSYASATEVKALSLIGLNWDDSGETPRPEGDGRPPYRFRVLRVQSFIHEGHAGDLHLAFFNDRLMEATFYPEDPPGYRAALARSGLLPRGCDERLLPPYTKVWTATDIEGREYVSWADARLLDQQFRWLSRYS